MPPAMVTSLRISSSTETNHVKPSIRPNRGRHICHGLNQVHANILVLRCSKYSPTCGNRANQQRTTRKGRSQASAPKSHEYCASSGIVSSSVGFSWYVSQIGQPMANPMLTDPLMPYFQDPGLPISSTTCRASWFRPLSARNMGDSLR